MRHSNTPMNFLVVLFWIISVQNRSKWIKLDQIWISHLSKIVTIKSCHIYHVEKNCHYIFDQIGSELSKMDQT